MSGTETQSPEPTKKAVVLMSGGIDSTLCASLAIERGYDIRPLVISYGQKNSPEIECALDIAHWFGAAYQTNFVELDPAVFKGSVSSMTSDGVTELDRSAYGARSRAVDGEVTSSVPFRNGIFMSIATAYALSCGAEIVYCGVTGEGASQYADCDKPFLQSMTAAIHHGSERKVQLHLPLSSLTKVQIVELAVEAWRDGRVPLQLTRSCYDRTPFACGTCLACQERLAAFEALKVKDPVRYMKTR